MLGFDSVIEHMSLNYLEADTYFSSLDEVHLLYLLTFLIDYVGVISGGMWFGPNAVDRVYPIWIDWSSITVKRPVMPIRHRMYFQCLHVVRWRISGRHSKPP